MKQKIVSHALTLLLSKQNEWDMSCGTFCAMKRKHKCIFAHGPVELRVKEGKRQRWGTLVNKQGELRRILERFTLSQF